MSTTISASSIDVIVVVVTCYLVGLRGGMGRGIQLLLCLPRPSISGFHTLVVVVRGRRGKRRTVLVMAGPLQS